MKLPKPSSTGVVSVNMTPMIDMVFNLLIFFILTSQFAKLDTEEVILPLSTSAENKDYTQYRNVVINVCNPDNPKVIVMGQHFNNERELADFLTQVKQEAGTDPLNVILRADQDIAYEEVARVMLATGMAQIQGWWIQTEILDLDKLKKNQP